MSDFTINEAPAWFPTFADAQEFMAKHAGGNPFDYARDRPETLETARQLGIEALVIKAVQASREMDSAVQASVKRAEESHTRRLKTATREATHEMDRVRVVRGDGIRPVAVDWLWEGFLATGKVHIMAGAPGTGKTTLAIGLAAALTTGGYWPDRSQATPGDVLIWSGEDSIEDTLVPRLIAAGADLTRVHFVGERMTSEGARSFDPASDFQALEVEAAAIPNLRLVLVDPIVSAIAGDGHKSNDVRRGLQPLVHFAQRLGCAVLGISHFSKGTAGKDPVERVTGSIAFGALARVVLATAKISDEEGGGRLLVRAKSNIGPDGGGFRYDLRLVELGAAHPGISATRPEWLGAIDGEARELLAAVEERGDPEERSATSEAVGVLKDLLEGGRQQTKEVRRQLKAQGFTEKQIRSAREKLGIKRERDGFGGTDFWSMPDLDARSCPVPAVHAHPERQGTNGQEWAAKGMNGEPADEDLMRLVERVGALYKTAAAEIETMKAMARADPTQAWRAYTADLEAAKQSGSYPTNSIAGTQ